MKKLVLAVVLVLVLIQFSFVYAAKPFCQDNADGFSLAMVSGILGAYVVGYNLGKGKIGFNDVEKEGNKTAPEIANKIRIFCSNQENKNKKLSSSDVLKLIITDSNFGVASAGGDSGGSSGISKYERFLIKADSETRKNSKLRKCIMDDSDKDMIKFVESKFDELESLTVGKEKYPESILGDVFKGKTKKLFEALNSSWKKCS